MSPCVKHHLVIMLVTSRVYYFTTPADGRLAALPRRAGPLRALCRVRLRASRPRRPAGALMQSHTHQGATPPRLASGSLLPPQSPLPTACPPLAAGAAPLEDPIEGAAQDPCGAVGVVPHATAARDGRRERGDVGARVGRVAAPLDDLHRRPVVHVKAARVVAAVVGGALHPIAAARALLTVVAGAVEDLGHAAGGATRARRPRRVAACTPRTAAPRLACPRERVSPASHEGRRMCIALSTAIAALPPFACASAWSTASSRARRVGSAEGRRTQISSATRL